jgi:hypothetical protein
MSHSTKRRIAASALTAMALAAAASINPAHADVAGQDWKGYSGVNCLPQSNNDAIRRSAVNQSAFANTGTSTITVFCPVVRDESAGGAMLATTCSRTSSTTGSMRRCSEATAVIPRRG